MSKDKSPSVPLDILFVKKHKKCPSCKRPMNLLSVADALRQKPLRELRKEFIKEDRNFLEEDKIRNQTLAENDKIWFQRLKEHELRWQEAGYEKAKADILKIIDNKVFDGSFYFDLHTRGCKIENSLTQSHCSGFKEKIVKELKEEIKNLKSQGTKLDRVKSDNSRGVSTDDVEQTSIRRDKIPDTRKGCGKMLYIIDTEGTKMQLKCGEFKELPLCESCRGKK